MTSQPAVEPAAAYPIPSHLTPGGLIAFNAEVTRYAEGLGAELARQAIAVRSRGGHPEHTAESVEKAKRSHLRGLLIENGPSDHRTSSDRSVPAFVFVTIGTIGLNVMINFMHGPWQVAVFVAFVVIGLAGLGLAWTGRTARSPVAGDP